MASAKYQELLERLPQVAKPWKAALYIRLSREDGDKVESNSITSQREILKEYLKLHPDIELHDFYIDDGWSGTNFDRPGFIRMMEDIYSGDVNCVIVKDLSRFGRNYTDAGNYLDNIFVRLQIRLVIYKRGCYSLRFFLYDEGDWLTEFPIGTPRPPINVSASLHHSAFDSASWDKSLLPFHELI